MAPVILATAATAIAGSVGAVLAPALVTWTAVAVSTAATAVLQGASYLLQKSMGRGGGGVAEPVAAPINASRAIPIAQPIPPRRFVFGKGRVGGAVVFQENRNPKLYIATALSDGVIESVDTLHFGEVEVPLDGSGGAFESSPYFERVKLEWSSGAPDQAASATLLGAFPDLLGSNFRQRGVARAVVEMDWGDDPVQNRALWGSTVYPTLGGRFLRCYDPRDNSQSVTDEATWKYTENPVLHTAFVLTKAWGVALSPDDVNWFAVSEAANDCDAPVSYGGQTLPIFTGAGVFQAGVEFGRQVADMLTAYRGRIVYQDGQYGIVADKHRPSVWTITDDDIYEIGTAKLAADSNEMFGAISAVFYDSEQGGVRDTTDVFEAEAGGRETSITLPFTDRKHSAQILAYRELVQSRDGRGFTIRVTDAGSYLAPGDRVTLQLESETLLNGDYTVEQVDIVTPGVRLSLKGYRQDVYADPSAYLV